MTLLTITHDAPRQIEVAATWLGGRGSMVIVGYSKSFLPKAGVVRSPAIGPSSGIFRAESWPRNKATGYAFIAVVQFASERLFSRGECLVLKGSRLRDVEIRLEVTDPTSSSQAGEALAKLATGSEPLIAKFIVGLIPPDDDSRLGYIHPFVVAFLDSVATTDGCVELLLSLPKELVILQGWGSDLSYETPTIIAGRQYISSNVKTGTFRRQDVSAPSVGSVITFESTDIRRIAAENWIYLLTESRILKRSVVSHQMLETNEALGQLKHLLPRLRCDEELQRTFQNALLPVFEGVETLSRSRHPLRAAIDMALSVEDVGFYISGWIWDPARAVRSIFFCTQSFEVPIDSKLERIARPDVAKALSGEYIGPVLAGNDWGFAAFVEDLHTENLGAYLRLHLVDDEVVFFPARIDSLADLAGVSKLIAHTDMHSPSFENVISRALGPFLKRSLVQLNLPRTPRFCAGQVTTDYAMVIPLHRGQLPRSLISSLFWSKMTHSEQVVFVCGESWSAASKRELTDILSFYDIRATILDDDCSLHPVMSTLAGASICGASRILFVSEYIDLPTFAERERLYLALDSYDVICPTTLYSDRSVRFAGSLQTEVLDRPPYVRLRSPRAGFSADCVLTVGVEEAEGGTLDCLAIRVDALRKLADLPPFLTRSVGIPALFHHMSQAGLQCGWDGGVQVIISDECEPADKASLIIDGWMFSRHAGTEPCAH